MNTSRIDSLPPLYSELIYEARDNITKKYFSKIECLAVCGGCSRGNVLEGYSDIDLFVISRLGESIPRDRYFSKDIKISLESLSREKLISEKFCTKVLYFLRSVKSEKAIILYGSNRNIPMFSFEYFQKSAASQENIKSIFDLFIKDFSLYSVEPSNKNLFVLLKHTNTIMKNLLRIEGYDLDDYRDVNNTFKKLYQFEDSIIPPTPREAIYNGVGSEHILRIIPIFLKKCGDIIYKNDYSLNVLESHLDALSQIVNKGRR